MKNFANPSENREDQFDLSPLRRWEPSDLERPNGTPGFLFDCRFLDFQGRCPGGCLVGPAKTFEAPFVGVVEDGTIKGSFCADTNLEAIIGREETSSRYLWHFVDLHEFLDFYLQNLKNILGKSDRVTAFESVASEAKTFWPIPPA